MPLPDGASAQETRVYARLTEVQWDHFVEIALKEAKKLREDNPNITWQDVDEGKRNHVLENINLKLEQKKIRTVDLEVVARSVGRTLIRLKYNGKKSAQLAGKSAPSSTAISSPKEGRPYDPVRDV